MHYLIVFCLSLIHTPHASARHTTHHIASLASQLTISKITAYFEIVVKTKLKQAEEDGTRQKRLDQGLDVVPMTQAEKVTTQ